MDHAIINNYNNLQNHPYFYPANNNNNNNDIYNYPDSTPRALMRPGEMYPDNGTLKKKKSVTFKDTPILLNRSNSNKDYSSTCPILQYDYSGSGSAVMDHDSYSDSDLRVQPYSRRERSRAHSFPEGDIQRTRMDMASNPSMNHYPKNTKIVCSTNGLYSVVLSDSDKLKQRSSNPSFYPESNLPSFRSKKEPQLQRNDDPTDSQLPPAPSLIDAAGSSRNATGHTTHHGSRSLGNVYHQPSPTRRYPDGSFQHQPQAINNLRNPNLHWPQQKFIPSDSFLAPIAHLLPWNQPNSEGTIGAWISWIILIYFVWNKVHQWILPAFLLAAFFLLLSTRITVSRR